MSSEFLLLCEGNAEIQHDAAGVAIDMVVDIQSIGAGHGAAALGQIDAENTLKRLVNIVDRSGERVDKPLAARVVKNFVRPAVGAMVHANIPVTWSGGRDRGVIKNALPKNGRFVGLSLMGV